MYNQPYTPSSAPQGQQSYHGASASSSTSQQAYSNGYSQPPSYNTTMQQPSSSSQASTQEGLSFYPTNFAQHTMQSYGMGRTNTPDMIRATTQPSSSTARKFAGHAFGSGGFTDEASLLEELEINIPHIRTKTFTVLNPLRTPDKHLMDDTDIAGPIFFWALFGLSLMLAGKVHFSYVYGIALCGVIGVYWILNLMSENGIELMCATSILGYCMLPMVLSSLFSPLPFMTGLPNLLSAVTSITWCTYSATLLFTTTLSMREQRFLIAYPIGVVYASFALMTIF